MTTIETYSTANNVATLTVTKPTGVAEFDLLLGFAASRQVGGGFPITPPSGFTEVFEDGYTSSFGLLEFCRAIAGGSEPANYSWGGLGSGSPDCGAVLRVSGHDPTTPVNVTGTGKGFSTTATFPSVTTTAANCLILRVAGGGVNSAGVVLSTPPSSHTQLFSHVGANSTDSLIGVWYTTQASAGATGTATAVYSNSTFWCAATIAIAPAAGGGSPVAAIQNHRRNQGMM